MAATKWIGSGGTSPFGHGGAHPEGIRIGGASKGGKSAVKVWEMRGYRDYDDAVEIGTRNIKVALRRLRRFAREGAELELDMHDTIESTAKNAGWLDLKLVPERHNTVKVLMLLDVGGTMDEHIKRTEELFSAAKSEFKHLEFYYFHNCVYEFLVAQQPAPIHGASCHMGCASQVSARLEVDFCRRCDDEPVRSAAARWLGRVQQRRSGCGMAAAVVLDVSEVGVAQPGARADFGSTVSRFR